MRVFPFCAMRCSAYRMLSTCAGTGHCHFCILAAAAPWQAHGTGHKLNYRRKCGDSRYWDGTIIFFKENFGVFGDQWDGTTGETTPPWDGTSPNLWIYYGTSALAPNCCSNTVRFAQHAFRMMLRLVPCVVIVV